MCDSDINIITFNWVKGKDLPWAMYDGTRNCRKYEDILSWAEDHASSIGADLQLPKPLDAKEVDFGF